MRDLKSKAAKIEKDKEAPKKEQLHALRSYIYRSREEHEAIREKSREHEKPPLCVTALTHE